MYRQAARLYAVEIPEPELYVIYPGERNGKLDEISLARDIFRLKEPDMAFVDVLAKINNI